MLVKNRPRLTRQALDSLYSCTKVDTITLNVLDDGSDEETREVLENELKYFPNHGYCHQSISEGTGVARNKVIALAEEFGRGDYLYCSDNDICFKTRWLETLIEAFEYAHAELGFRALGAYAHPYLRPNRSWPFYSTVAGRTIEIVDLDALPLQSWLMKWEDWDRYGQFCETPVGKVRQSEDHEYSQRIRKDGFRVGVVSPALLWNCGITDSFGEPIPGAELIERPEWILVE